MTQAEPCRCPEPNPECKRSGFPMLGRLWELCANKCPPDRPCHDKASEQCRAEWDRRARQVPCAHLGNPTGQTVECQSCNGKVHLKTFYCLALGSCTTSKKLDGIACCAGCPEYLASTDSRQSLT